MADNAVTSRGARSSWLAYTAAGEKFLEIISRSVQTRIKFGSDREVFVEISTRSEKGGEFIRMEADLCLMLRHASAHCASVVIERSSYDDAANSLRGSVTLDSNEQLSFLTSDQITQRRNSLSIAKYRSERACIQEMRDQAAQLVSMCDQLLSRVDSRIKRGAAQG